MGLWLVILIEWYEEV